MTLLRETAVDLRFCYRLLVSHVNEMHLEARTVGKVNRPLKDSQKKTPLQNLNSWKSKDEFVAYMTKSIFFNYDGIVGLNKPYGVPVYKQDPTVAKTTNFLSRSKIPEIKYSVEDALPALRNHLDVKNLQIMKSAERFTSGVCVLAADERTANIYKKCIRRATAEHVPYQSYWAVTRGSPIPAVACKNVGYMMVPVENQGKEPEVIWNPSRNQSKRKEVKLVSVEHQIISCNPNLQVALCQVDTTTNKAHFVRVYLIRNTSCVLGDTVYSPRLRSVLGHTIVLSPQNYDKTIDPLPTLKNQVIRNLELNCENGNEMAHLPVMLHFRSLTLKKWRKNKDLVLTAPIPEHFSWACSKLNLDAISSHTNLQVAENPS